MLPLLGLILMVSASLAVEKTVCECTNPTQVGILQFADGNCEAPAKPEQVTDVTYSVYTEQRAALTFPASVCGRWKQIRHITTNFLRQEIVVPDKVPMETSAAECQIMRQSLRCNDKPMTLSDNKWSYNEEPEIVGYWLYTVTVEIINCAVEEISLLQEKEEDDLITPLGSAKATAGTLTHNHLTIVWDAKFTSTVDHKPRLLESGSGQLSRLNQPPKTGTFRLQDVDQKLDFHLTYQPRCIIPQPDCVKNKGTYDITGETKLYVIIKNGSDHYAPPATAPKTVFAFTKLSNGLARAQFQYLQDQLTDHENDLARAVHNLQCEARRATHAQAISTAQYNGWLAASQLKLPRCTKLIAAGQTVVAVQCRPTNVTFTTEITACGPQPRYQNYTINLDGWELVPFSTCYWTMGFVNFNNLPHAYRDNTWVPIEATVVLPTRDLADSFRYDDVDIFPYEHQSNPAYSDTAMNHMNIIADIAAAMNEHSAGNVSGPGQSSSGSTNLLISASEKLAVNSFSDWFETFKIYGFIALLIIVALLIARGCYAVGLCGVIWTVCCKPPKKPNSTRTPRAEPHSTGLELQQFRPLVNAAIQSQAL